ncbi:hypothetical protein L211DRAFT_208855 [Terfezia boudieri ATCC MYA-4762]|uniref:Uncharacterized protein n=1 Tax=Terfezia boudieri ATCC MYA-4762 TaxID=1051890 RepID=A0A3N4LMS6_9PEZI|nr:hypothetical protein L211DRAFT_208855 [Terfezia boudieri ATCC MYA-4762]
MRFLFLFCTFLIYLVLSKYIFLTVLLGVMSILYECLVNQAGGWKRACSVAMPIVPHLHISTSPPYLHISSTFPHLLHVSTSPPRFHIPTHSHTLTTQTTSRAYVSHRHRHREDGTWYLQRHNTPLHSSRMFMYHVLYIFSHTHV